MQKWNYPLMWVMLGLISSITIFSCSETLQPVNQEQSVTSSQNIIKQTRSRALRIESAWSQADIIHQYQSPVMSNNGLTNLKLFPKENGGLFATWRPEYFDPNANVNLAGAVNRVYFRNTPTSTWMDISPAAPIDTTFGWIYSHKKNGRVFAVWSGTNQCFINYYDTSSGWSTAVSCGIDATGNAKTFFTGLSREDGTFQAIFKAKVNDESLLLLGEIYSPDTGWQDAFSMTVPVYTGVESYLHSPHVSSIGSDRTLVVWKQGFYSEPNHIVSATFNGSTGWSSPTTLSTTTVSDAVQVLLSSNSDTGTAELVIAEPSMGRLTNSSYSVSFDGYDWGTARSIEIGKKLSYASNANGDMLIAWASEIGNAGLGQPLFSVQSKLFNSTSGWQPTLMVRSANLLSRYVPKTALSDNGEATVGWIERSDVNELFVSNYSENEGWSAPELTKNSNSNARIGELFFIAHNQSLGFVLWDEAETIDGKVMRTVFISNHQNGGQAVQPPLGQTPELPTIPLNTVIAATWTDSQQVWSSLLSTTNYTGVFGPMAHIGNDNTPILHYQEYSGSPYLPNRTVKTHAMRKDTTGVWVNDSPIPGDMDNNVRFFDLAFAFNEAENISYSVWSTSDDRLYLSSRHTNAAWSLASLIDASQSYLRVINIIPNENGVQVFWVTDKTLSTASYSETDGLSVVNTIDLTVGQSIFQIIKLLSGQYVVAVIERQNPLSKSNLDIRLIKYQTTTGWEVDSKRLVANDMDFFGLYPTQLDGAILLGRSSSTPVELTDPTANGPLSAALYSSSTGWNNFTPINQAIVSISNVESTPFVMASHTGELVMIWSAQMTDTSTNSAHKIFTSQLTDNGTGILLWSPPVAIGDTSPASFETRPKLVMADNGAAMALWVDKTSVETAVWTKRYTKTNGWKLAAEKIISLSVDDGYIVDFDAVATSKGTVFLVWKHLMANTIDASYSIFESETIF